MEKKPTPLKGIALTGEVNLEMYRTLLRGLARVDQTQPVEIIVNTEGGCVYQALAIYDRIKMLSKITTVNITCEGPVMSSGTIILQAATNRYMMKHSFLMIHYGEDTQDSAQSKRHSNELDKIYKKIIGDRATVGSRTLYNWLTKDHYFNAEHAVRVGLVDKVIG